MTLKGDYNPEVTYDIGDVVRFSNAGYRLDKEASAGTPPNVDRCWTRLDQSLWDVVDMILDVAVTNVSDDGIILKGDNGEYLISVDDSGETPELAVDLIEEES